MYEGKVVRLRRLEREDASTILPSWNEYALRQYLASPLPNGQQEMADKIDSWNEAFATRREFVFGIEHLETGGLIGLVSLENVSWISRHASVGFLGIFNTSYLGKGCGSDAMIVLLDVAFSVMDLQVVFLWVESFNERAISLYKKLGFTAGGTMRQLAYRNGKRCDVTVMDILKPEYMEKHGVLPKEGAAV
jgi:RimJ/RimL family protein N-acetyltransferase